MGRVSGIVKKALDMSREARMQRARDMGFDTGTAYYHGTPDARPIREAGKFDRRTITRRPILGPDVYDEREGLWFANQGEPETFKQATYLTPDRGTAATYADGSRAFDAQSAVPDVIELRARTGNLLDLDAQGHRFNEVPVDRVRSQLPEESRAEFDRLVARYGDPMLFQKGKMRTGDLEVIAQQMGYDGFRIRNVRDRYDGGGSPTTIVAVYDPARLRSPEAAFDPAKKGSSDILAGVGGAAVLGGSMSAPEAAQAASSQGGGGYHPTYNQASLSGGPVSPMVLPVYNPLAAAMADAIESNVITENLAGGLVDLLRHTSYGQWKPDGKTLKLSALAALDAL